jgi:mycothiol S-conjugate amidase
VVQILQGTGKRNDTVVRPTMLAVLAHPDDESFGMGGTLAYHAWCGVAVHLICATGGELGDVAPEFLQGYASVAERRRAELDGAARALGLSSVIMLGYRDSGMAGTAANKHPEALAAQPVEAVIPRVVAEIRRLRPQVVVTFDPIGGYRHPDHIAIHKATVAAFQAAGDGTRYPEAGPPYQPQRLYYHTFSRHFLRLVVAMMPLFGRDPHHFGRNKDMDIASLAEVEFPIHARIDISQVLQQKVAAGQAHASQGGGSAFSRGPLGFIFRLLGGQETFMQAYPAAPKKYRITNLFAGVEW